MSITDYELKAAGATYGAKYSALDENGWTWAPKGAMILSAVGQAQFQTGEEKDGHIAVPLWALTAAVDGAYEPSGLGLYASDSMIKSTVIGATLKDAEDKGFYMRDDKRSAWRSLEAHAHDLAEFAAAQRAAGNPEPYILEEDDFHTLVVPAWGAGHPLEMLNDLAEGDDHVSTKIAWLLYPITPSPDLSEGTDAYAVLMHLLSTAKTHEPGLANISLHLAVARLMHVPLPYQLASIGVSLMDRINYVSRLAAWADTSRRSSILQSEFKVLLNDLTALSKWVRTGAWTIAFEAPAFPSTDDCHQRENYTRQVGSYDPRHIVVGWQPEGPVHRTHRRKEANPRLASAASVIFPRQFFFLGGRISELITKSHT